MKPEEARRRQMLDALLHTPDLLDRYLKQATFRNAVDVLIDTLPLHVKAMAESADTVESRRQVMVDSINRTNGSGAGGDWRFPW